MVIISGTRRLQVVSVLRKWVLIESTPFQANAKKLGTFHRSRPEVSRPQEDLRGIVRYVRYFSMQHMWSFPQFRVSWYLKKERHHDGLVLCAIIWEVMGVRIIRCWNLLSCDRVFEAPCRYCSVVSGNTCSGPRLNGTPFFYLKALPGSHRRTGRSFYRKLNEVCFLLRISCSHRRTQINQVAQAERKGTRIRHDPTSTT
jgi:hypothetical protein